MSNKIKYILDTNLFVAANLDNTANHLSMADQVCCFNFLKTIYQNSIICIDDEGKILSEYFNNVSRSGNPGFGDKLAKWIFDNQYFEEFCLRAKVIYDINNPKIYEEFPDDLELERFDKSDRKFIAVSVFFNKLPIICNASDNDWKEFEDHLKKNGFKLKFILR